ncbi:MAG: hypothetical protein ABEJ79_00555 [Halolamina sp.]
MYLSHPVRRLREDPIADDVALVVEVADDAAREDDPTTLRAAVEAVGGEVAEPLGYGAYRVTLPATAVDELCTRLAEAEERVERVETAATLELALDDDSVKGGDGVDPDRR